MVFIGGSFEIMGGMDVFWSLLVDYFKYVIFYVFEKMGIKVEFEIKRCGYYFRGGGLVVGRIEFWEEKKFLKVLKWERIEWFVGISYVMNFLVYVVER